MAMVMTMDNGLYGIVAASADATTDTLAMDDSTIVDAAVNGAVNIVGNVTAVIQVASGPPVANGTVAVGVAAASSIAAPRKEGRKHTEQAPPPGSRWCVFKCSRPY
jgi:hypothetical protein